MKNYLFPATGTANIRCAGRVFFIALALFLTLPAVADEFDDLMSGGSSEQTDSTAPSLTFDFSGHLQARLLHDIEKNNEDEDLAKLRLATFAQGIFGISDKVSFLMSGLMEYDLDTDWEDTTSKFEPRLWEMYATIRVGDFDFLFGQQVVTWGILDAINVVNNVNPLRFEDVFVYLNDGYNKAPIPVARAVWYFASGFYLEADWMPFFRPMEFDALGSDWSIGGPVFPINLVRTAIARGNSRAQRTIDFLDAYLPHWDSRVENATDNLEKYFEDATQPRVDNLANSEFGVRTGGSFWLIDFALSYLCAWDDIPTLHVNRELVRLSDYLYNVQGHLEDLLTFDYAELSPLLEVEYHRVHSLGMELGFSPGGWSFRAEAVYEMGRYTYLENLLAEKQDVLTWSASAEYSLPWDLIIVGQYYQTFRPQWHDELLGKQITHYAGLLVRKTFLREKLEFYGVGLYDLTYIGDDKVGDGKLEEQGFLIAPMVSYKITDDFQIRAGATIFGGDRFSLIGYLRDNSQASVSAKFNF